MALEEVTNAGSTPPCSKGVKNGHSPWSAPRERKRRSKPVLEALSSIEEAAYTSPPKRHNGGSSPAARELALHEEPLGSPFAAADAAVGSGEAPGPLAQGLLSPGSVDASFSPLASGLAAPTLAAAGGVSFEQPVLHPGGAAATAAIDKQRRHLRPAAAWRLAVSRQRDAAAAAAVLPTGSLDTATAAVAAAAALGSSAEPGAALGQPPAFGSGLLWQSAPPAMAVPHPSSLAAPQEQPQQQQQRRQQASASVSPIDLALPPAPGPAAPAPAQALQPDGEMHACMQQGGGGRTAARCSTGQDMETDLRSSWGSERSADVASWQALQTRLREELAAEPLPSPRLPMLRQDDNEEAVLARLAAAAEAVPGMGRQPSLAASDGDAAMRASGEGAPSVHSVRSSLDGPSCSERQTSTLPLRATMRSHHWHSHLAASPGADGASPDPLLRRTASGSSSGRRRSRGSNSKWGCFSCASPFSCKQRPPSTVGDDSDDEVVRRNDSSEGFVIRRKQSFPERPTSSTPAAAAAARSSPQHSAPRSSADHLKRASLNRPPPGDEQDLVLRQDAFSARSTPPGAPWSPCSDAGSDGSFSLASGPGLRSVGLRDASIEELAGGGSEGASTPTVDALNDMLKALSLCPAAHPKDAEELVAQACKNHAIQPNATTARTLEKLWAVHEQLYG